jgi:tripartite-type tricarboxylate transporter receptor subunit TctC
LTFAPKEVEAAAAESAEGRAAMKVLSIVVWVSAVLTAGGACAQTNYPDKPVRIIVGFTPGSATDITARIFAQKFNEAWNVPVTVENIPGSGGAVAAERLAKAAPDGTTLMWGANGAITINPSLQSKIAYDPVTDFAPISLALRMASIVAVNNDVPVKDFRALLALAKAHPGELSYATPGVGTPQHIGGELLKMLAAVNIVHVPYRGAVFTDVIGGRVTIAWQNSGSILAVVREGKLRGLAVTSLQRSPIIPDLPTIAESGFPGFEATSWFALLAPAGTPAPIVAKLNQATLAVLQDPDMRARFAQLGLDPVGTSPEELGTTIKSDIAKWAKVIAQAGIRAGE